MSLLTIATNFVRGCTADLNPVDRDPGTSIKGTAQCLKNAIQVQLEPYKERLIRLLHRSDKT